MESCEIGMHVNLTVFYQNFNRPWENGRLKIEEIPCWVRKRWVPRYEECKCFS